MATILIVDDDELVLESLKMVLKEAGYKVKAVSVPEKALSVFDKDSIDLVITDLKMPNISGIELLKEIKQKAPDCPVIMMTAYATVETAVEAMKQGAVDYIMKPFSADELELIVKRAIKEKEIKEENLRLKEIVKSVTKSGDSLFVGEHPKIKELKCLIEKIALTDATVLIMGESGTGKELVAKMIHSLSPRQNGPYIRMNCAAIPEGLIESELFGFERGAFTGAVQPRRGKFELANGGTILLDEIGEMPINLQAKLLRVLQEKEIDRLGGKTIPVDVRVIATTNRDLAKEVKEGRFREDLFYRLSVFPIYIPPLRDRRDDIPLLVQHFLSIYSRKVGKEIEGVEKKAMQMLVNYDWPGNVRELENCIYRAVILANGPTVKEEDILFSSALCPTRL